jgi:HSP20 family protein
VIKTEFTPHFKVITIGTSEAIKPNVGGRNMRLVRYNPWEDVTTAQRVFNRIFDETWETARYSKLPAEIHDSNDTIYLKLAIPGIKAEDLDIQVADDTVSITGERKSEAKTEDKGNIRSEFQYGKFQRVISLPVKVKNHSVTAEYKDGILHLTLPKAEDSKVVKISLTPAV